MITLKLVFLICALLSFLLATLRIPETRVNYMALGLLFWILATIAS